MAENIRDEQPVPYVVPLSTDGSEILSFEPRKLSGWAAFFTSDTEVSSVFLRIGPKDKGDIEAQPLGIREVRVIEDIGPGAQAEIDGGSLRSLPWERVEAAINHPTHRRVLNGLVQPGFIAAESLPGESQTFIIRPKSVVPATVDAHLDIPPAYRKPDEFYRQVVNVYLSLASVTARPAQEIAEANNVKPTTVHGWIREAKARRILLLPRDRRYGP